MNTPTHSLEQVAEAHGATVRWLADMLRAGLIPGRKIANHWRMTDADIEAMLEFCAHPAGRPTAAAHPIGMTQTSRRRTKQAS